MVCLKVRVRAYGKNYITCTIIYMLCVKLVSEKKN